MKTIFISLLVVVVCMITSTALRGQNKPPGKFWQKLGENDSLVIESLSSLNSSRNDYSPIFLDGVLYFTSSRKDRYTDESTLQYNESIYTSYYQDSVWSQPKKHYFFNTDDYTSLAGFCSDRSKIFTYKTFGDGDLYCSLQNEKGKWFRSKRMRYVNSMFHEQSVAEAHGIMVVSSDRSGGCGQHDLYWSVADDNGQYLDFFVLDSINTYADEVDVSFSVDGKTLYFSSNVASSLGGYNLFFTQLDSTRRWSKPQELFMNTSGDDRCFMNCDSMFFCSRSGEFGDDLYWGHIIPKYKRDTSLIKKLTSLQVNLNNLSIDTLLVQNLVNFNKRPTEPLFFMSDGMPDTLKQQKLLDVYETLDSLKFEVYASQVQVGAYYYIRSVDEFKHNFGAFDTTGIIIEKVVTQKGTLYKYLIDETFTTLQDGAVRQQEALHQQTSESNLSYYPKGRAYDAFIVVYNEKRERIIIYFNVAAGDFQVLFGDQKIKF